MRAVIFSGGRLRTGRYTQAAIETADLIVAADSGARTALEFNALLSVVIGDMDSLDIKSKKYLEDKGVKFLTYETEKEQTDTELALNHAVESGADSITVLGGIEGDRIDHILANLFISMDTEVPIRFVNGDTLAYVIKGPATTSLEGQTGDLVSLIPLSPEATGLKTSGLKYPLNGETLLMNQSRGVSNVMTRKRASISLESGLLLLVQIVGEE